MCRINAIGENKWIINEWSQETQKLIDVTCMGVQTDVGHQVERTKIGKAVGEAPFHHVRSSRQDSIKIEFGYELYEF